MKTFKRIALVLTVLMLLVSAAGVVGAEETASGYVYTLDCVQNGDTVTADLYISGGKVQSGSFGFAFDTNVIESVNFSYTHENVLTVGDRNGFFHSSADQYRDSWILEATKDPIYVDGTSGNAKLGQFTITLKSGASFSETSITVATPDTNVDKAYVDGTYYVIPYSSGLGISHVPVTTTINVTAESIVTFKVNTEDTEAYHTSKGLPGTAISFPAADPVKANHSFKFWSVDGINPYTATVIPESDVTLVAVFEYLGTMGHLYTLEVVPADTTLTANLYYRGGNVQSGTFGIEYDASVITLDKFELALPSAKLVGNITNFQEDNVVGSVGRFVDRWILEDLTGNVSIDATTDRQLIGTFTFNIVADATFTLEDIYPAVCDETPKAYIEGYYVVSPYYNNATVVHEKVEFAPVIYASMNTTVDVNIRVHTVATESSTLYTNLPTNKEGVTYDSRAMIQILNSNEEVVATQYQIEAAEVNDFTFEVNAGETYTLVMSKNGYITHTETINADGSVDEINIEYILIPGDIKGSVEDFCGNGKVDIEDFLRCIRAFDTESSGWFIAVNDINEDGDVTILDLTYVKMNFGKTDAQ